MVAFETSRGCPIILESGQHRDFHGQVKQSTQPSAQESVKGSERPEQALGARAQLTSGGETIDDAFGAQWDTTVGRQDVDAPDPEGRVPKPGASTAEIKVGFRQVQHEHRRDRGWLLSGSQSE